MNSLPITLETKDLLSLLLLPMGTIAVTLALLMRPQLRLAALFLLVAGLPACSLFDVNIFSAYWYRGSTRGFEATIFDVIALGMLFSSLLSPRGDQKRWYWPVSLGFMLLYLAYCVISTATASPWIFGVFEISKLLRGIAFFLVTALYVRRERDLSVVALGLAVAILAESALATRERLVLGVYRPTGTLFHPNSLSMYFCMAVPVLIAAGCCLNFAAWIRRICWVAALAGACTMLLALSRAGLPIFTAVCGGTLLWCGGWKPSPGRLAGGAVALVALVAVGIKAWPSIMERYHQATLQEEYFDADGESRGYYFRQAEVILQERPFGVGLNNWSYWVSKEYGRSLDMRYENYDGLMYAPPSELMPEFRFAAPAHNLGVLTVGEVGWAGLAIFTVLWVRWMLMGAGFLFRRQVDTFHRFGVGLCFATFGVFLHSFTEWIFRQTEIFLSFHLLIGIVAALISIRREATAAVATEAETATSAEPDWDTAVPLRPAFNPTDL
jgi:hypothetical protein